MDSDYGVARELSDLQKQRVLYQPGLPPCLQVNSQLISNVCTDALSAEKTKMNLQYYYFIRLMGRKASHVALECTLQSHPNMVKSDDSAQLSQAMMTVKRWSHGPGAMPIGKPAIHPATVDLKGKAYEYVFVRSIVKPGCPQEVLKAALSSMASVTDVLSVMSSSSLNGQTPL
ncbi:hypothetical protein B296_00009274 [Ensete ventricosum]|uniref:Phosphofructokinase domain-containing protein n=1 Tax=Ensete ventricosum TaxID=4639 RepID=A0A427B8G9_ENSVE|nr:hypothetical protein B296_00009274 [Ensete ventricosum]